MVTFCKPIFFRLQFFVETMQLFFFLNTSFGGWHTYLVDKKGIIPEAASAL